MILKSYPGCRTLGSSRVCVGSYPPPPPPRLFLRHGSERTASLLHTNAGSGAGDGVQVSKKLNDADSATAFSLGYAKRLQGGSLTKLKLNNTGARPPPCSHCLPAQG